MGHDGSGKITGHDYQPSQKKPQHGGKNRIFSRHAVGEAEDDTCHRQGRPLSPPPGQSTLNQAPEKEFLTHAGTKRNKQEVDRATLQEKRFHRGIHKTHEPSNRSHRKASAQQQNPKEDRGTHHPKDDPRRIRPHPCGHRQAEKPSKPQCQQAHSCFNPNRENEYLAAGETEHRSVHPV